MSEKARNEKKRQELVDHILDELVKREFTEYEAKRVISDLRWAVDKCISAHEKEKMLKKV